MCERKERHASPKKERKEKIDLKANSWASLGVTPSSKSLINQELKKNYTQEHIGWLNLEIHAC